MGSGKVESVKTKDECKVVKDELRYKIDDRPPVKVAIPLAIQNIVAAFSGIVAVPLVVGGALGLSVAEMAFLVNSTLFMAGVATFIQAYGVGPVGARLPCVMGTDFTFVGPSIAVGSSMGLPGIFGATLIASFVEIILSRFIRPLMKIFPPVVTGTVVTLIGLTILPVSVDWAAGGVGSPDYGSLRNVFLALTVMIIIMILNQWGKGFISAGSILIGIICGYIISIPMGLLDTTPVKEASWLSFPTPFKFGIKFSLTAILAFIPAYLVTTIESVGDLIAVGQASNHKLSSDELSRGILADGVGSFLAGIFNAGPNTSFSQNVGIIPITGVASRFVVVIAGIILMLSGIFPKLGALIAIMPQPVLGGAGIMMFGMIAVGGIKILKQVNFTRRNSLVVAISIGLGLAVVVRPGILEHFPQGIRTILESGITTGTISALILNLILPKKI
ncbi:nucleobase:cation symporter-2 family protein [Thermohalobacter berrensis]|uniref:Purine permease n=1 Tax=Thermohalobacter berrensis TaxID=99594 RepID=A0A419SV41_9FIRM|nr:nucleobase:cation symporter-2 family protein [Thermohalobacter berrensis]RKD29086.1 purine permease [Thermohalobacter berrensis]